MMQETHSIPVKYSWAYIRNIAKQHKRTLIIANLVAIVSALLSVPVPLLMPLLVDEVLLDKPAAIVGFLTQVFPPSWHSPVLFVVAVMLASMTLRLCSLLLAVVQTWYFMRVAKDISYRMRSGLLSQLQKISMAEYETLGTGSVTSHFVTDINAVDDFLGATLSKFVVAVLTVIGISGVLLWMHWQLALFIILMNPVVIFFTMVMGKKVKTLKRNENTAFEIFQQSLSETLDAIQQIRASNREQHYLQRVTERAAT